MTNDDYLLDEHDGQIDAYLRKIQDNFDSADKHLSGVDSDQIPSRLERISGLISQNGNPGQEVIRAITMADLIGRKVDRQYALELLQKEVHD